MAQTLFYGWTEAELLAELKKAQKEELAGKSIVSVGVEGTSTSKQIFKTPRERIEMIQHALHELDPDTYEAFATAGHSVTTAKFST